MLGSREAEQEGLSLRERKKLHTRQRISGAATALFIERGFDNVTVAEVARAAEVSTMTVFNYFPRKEDLFLDRIPEAIDLLVRAVRERDRDETPLAALRRLVLDLLARRHPLGGPGEGYEHFYRTVLDAPSLRARVREAAEEIEGALAGALAEASGADPARPCREVRLAAALIAAGLRSLCMEAVGRQLAGDPAAEVAADHEAVIRHTFDVLERALPDGGLVRGGPEGPAGRMA
ncbi:TetR/AcrR family transcriptional regulator [Streptomyces sp. RS10V-4]|nr:TetR family transcriptional regulator [Streptomyces rhizoryzae]MCK7622002.1 TetR/AcrR family transcriptional regulator [Streptomyces rhizoryzae]